MSDQMDGVSSDLVGESGDVSLDSGATDQTPTPVTQESLLALEARLRSDLSRELQSNVDKADRRITDRFRAEFQGIDAVVKMLQDGGIEVTPQQVEAIKQQRMIRGLQGSDQQASSGQGSPQGQQPGQPAQIDPQRIPPHYAAAFQMQQEAGVEIKSSDPEFALVDQSSPAKLLLTVQKAIDAKAKRLQQSESDGEDQGKPEVDKTKLAARSAGNVSGQKKTPKGSPDDLKALDYFKKHWE